MQSLKVIHKVNLRESRLNKSSSNKQQKIDLTNSERSASNKLQQYHKKLSIIAKIRAKTIQADRSSDHKAIYSSLSISSIPKQSPNQLKPHRKLLKNRSQIKGINLKSSLQSFIPENKLKPLKLILPLGYSQHKQSPTKLKKTKESDKYCKLKLYSKLNYRKSITLVISGDFIINQYRFWEDDQLYHNSQIISKFWNRIYSFTNLVWMVRSEKTAKILQKFFSINNLGYQAIFVIKRSKTDSLKISYHEFQQAFKLPQQDKVLIINSLRTDKLTQLKYHQFMNSLPIIGHAATFIHFIKINMNDKNRLFLIIKMISCELPQPFNIDSIVEQYQQSKKHSKIGMDAEQQQQFIEDGQIYGLSILQRAKTNILKHFDVIVGLNTRIQQNSMHFIIGDLLRRNVNIAKSMGYYYKKYQNRIQNIKYQQLAQKYQNKYITKKKYYTRPIFVWDF